MNANIKKELKSLKLKRDELRKQIAESAKTLFKETTATLFEECPTLAKFSWTQYTPYFNDGDVCNFNSHHDYPSIWFVDEVGDNDEEGDFYDHEYNDYSFKKYDEKKGEYVPVKTLTANQKAAKKVMQFLGNFDDDDFLQMFGDHAMVIVTRNGVEVEEYSHD